MNTSSLSVKPNTATKLLSILSLGTFWAVPFSPLIIIGAIVRTKHSIGWPRRMAVVAAILCTIYTVAAAIWIYSLTLHVLTGGLS